MSASPKTTISSPISALSPPREPQTPSSTASPSDQAVRRLSAEIFEFFKNPVEGLYIRPNEEDITQIDALIVGPDGTPYEGGFFHFRMVYPADYPFSPPAVQLLTTDNNRVRFNPNLYASGKVCLSILGTWPGPSWSCTLSLVSVLLSIQSLMNENPYHNEPGFESERQPGDAERYNRRVVHETLRVAICNMLERPDLNDLFRAEIESEFLGRYESLLALAETKSKELDGEPFQDPFGEMKGSFNFAAIAKRLTALHQRLVDDDSDVSEISELSEDDSSVASSDTDDDDSV